MGRALSLDLRERVWSFIEAGGSRRGAARHFRISVSSAVRTQLAPTLREGDVVIADNLKVHKSAKAAAILRENGAWFLFLPRYSPDLNPIEMAFAKLKAHLRRIGARTLDALWRAVGEICGLFDPDECCNNDLDGVECVWKAAGKRPYGEAAGIEGFYLTQNRAGRQDRPNQSTAVRVSGHLSRFRPRLGDRPADGKAHDRRSPARAGSDQGPPDRG